MEEAMRFDKNKNKLSLISPLAIEAMGRVLTFGAAKYEEHNWRKGMKWSKSLNSLKRHLLEFEKCNDKDEESGELHMAHVIVNAMFLIEYYYTHPELDDRFRIKEDKPKHYNDKTN